MAELKSHLLHHVASVEDSYSLRRFNPLGAGGVADFFTVATSTIELAAAVKAAIDIRMPYLVIGEGAATLFSDAGFPGLVIHNQAASFGVALDKNQIVVDSGITLSRLITFTVGRGLGGMLPFYGGAGTVGGALFENTVSEGQSILSSVRYVTMLVPPARIDKEATIVRYKGDWLHKSEEQTKLQYIREQRGLEEPSPVILTVLFQLTNVRTDELRIRLQHKMKEKLPANLMGPIFRELPGHVPMSDLLVGAQVAEINEGGVYPNRYFPNYLASRNKVARADDIRLVIEQMAERVQQMYGVLPVSRYEYGGVW